MKKILTLVVIAAMAATLALTAAAADVIYSNDFESGFDAENWHLGTGAPIVADGLLKLGSTGTWTADAGVTYNQAIVNYELAFDYTSNNQDCYSGFGLRVPADKAAGSLYNGGRNDIPSATETGYGISIDVGSKGTDCANSFVVSFNYGEHGQSPNYKVAYPEGFTGGAGSIKVVDSGDAIVIYLNDAELTKITFTASDDVNYTAATAYVGDAEVFSGEVTVAKEGGFSFYQRNNTLTIDNVVVTALEAGGEGDDAPETADAAVIVVAMVAAIALAGAVVCKKANA